MTLNKTDNNEKYPCAADAAESCQQHAEKNPLLMNVCISCSQNELFFYFVMTVML